MRSQHLLVVDNAGSDEIPTEGGFEDDRLRLIFTCCHPTLEPGHAGGALAANAVRTQHRRGRQGVPREGDARWPRASPAPRRRSRWRESPTGFPIVPNLRGRIDAVLLVVHLLFTTGHTAPVGDNLSQGDLVERSLDLARMLHGLLPDDAEVASLLALILLTDSRRSTRLGPRR